MSAVTWSIAFFAPALIAGAVILSLRLRRRGEDIYMRIAGFDDAQLASLGSDELSRIDDELHDCARQSDPAAATAIRSARQRIRSALERREP
ncbi:hypothetical protein SPF06_18650 [Sinomonas sp. JGH33]|uniref:DUF1127 domain-containing protein n=1 Tax=Sinomonas terricola TaxID=3110330 RepID=A0ABU5TAQ0_9MICC|nr:hypothetical protein [Sinomonas sp. JGH33]MEA5456748.1 hypothetical protein [Sinomonas sp. JGH33]